MSGTETFSTLAVDKNSVAALTKNGSFEIFQPVDEATPPFTNLAYLTSSREGPATSNDDYLKLHHIELYVRDVINLSLEKGTKSSSLSAEFLAGYFLDICAGRYGRGRPYSFASGTPTNRHHILRNARASFSEMCKSDKAVKLMDCLSLMMLLCPDFPLNVVRSAFKPAVFIAKGLANFDSPETDVSLNTFLECLSVTFIYERFLVEMRHDAFDSKSKQFIPAQRVKESMSSVYELVEAAGWSVPPSETLISIIDDAVDSKTCISFDLLVRAMCSSTAIRDSLQADEESTIIRAANAAIAIEKGIESFSSWVDGA